MQRPDTTATQTLFPAGQRSAAIDATVPGDSGGSTSSAVPSGAVVPQARFTIVRPHAEGGLGRVHIASDTQLRRTVALKEIRPERADDPYVRRRFLAEAEITGRLEHPGIVPIYALENDAAGRPVYAMRLIQGRTLAEAIQAHHVAATALGLRELLQRFIAVCQTLAYAHSQNVIHRDLKPANIMLGDYGETLVVDWGLAKHLDGNTGPGVSAASATWSDGPTQTLDFAPMPADSDAAQQTADGAILGTPAYMAPEQARGEAVGTLADVYSLGAILHEILTGQPPYTGNSALAILKQVLAGPPAGNIGGSRALAAVCRKAMSRTEADRYAGAAELARDVQRWLADEPVAAYREPWRDRAIRWARGHRTAVAALCAVVVLALPSGAGFVWWQGKQTAAAAIRERDERLRLGRNAEAVAALLEQCEAALRADDTERAGLAFDAADRRAAEGGAEAQFPRLQRCRTDLAVVRDLDELDGFRWGYFRLDRPPEKQSVDMAQRIFAHLGAVPGEVPPAEAARRIADSLLVDRLVPVLDEWPAGRPVPAVRELLRAVDPHGFRTAFREAALAGDAGRLAELAASPEAFNQPPAFLSVVAGNPLIPVERRRELLASSLRTRPSDLALLMALGRSYPGNTRDSAEQRVRWFQAAVAAHPNRVAAHVNLALALKDYGDLPGALAAYRDAIRCDPSSAGAQLNLGSTLMTTGDVDGAIVCFREACRLDPVNPKFPSHLGYILATYKKDYPAAAESLRTALRLDPNFSQAHAGMGLMLEQSGDPDGAIRSYREALRLNADYTLVHKQLGAILERRGDWDGAIWCYREIVRLYPTDPFYPRHLQRVERWRELLPQLTKISAGQSEAISPEQKCELAELCAKPFLQRYAVAARLYAAAFAADSRLAEDVTTAHRYHAAACAAAAGCGQGHDASPLSLSAAASLRSQALGWLRADLAVRRQQASSQVPADRHIAAENLAVWLTDARLGGVRPGRARMGLPAAERLDWDSLWAVVHAALDMAKGQ